MPIDDSAAPIRDRSGNIVGVVLVFRDITERKQLEIEFREHRDHLEELVAERTKELVSSNEQLAEGDRRAHAGGEKNHEAEQRPEPPRRGTDQDQQGTGILQLLDLA